MATAAGRAEVTIGAHRIVIALGGEAQRRRVGIDEQRRSRASGGGGGVPSAGIDRRRISLAARIVDAGHDDVVFAEGAARRQIAQRRVAGVGAELGLRRQAESAALPRGARDPSR